MDPKEGRNLPVKGHSSFVGALLDARVLFGHQLCLTSRSNPHARVGILLLEPVLTRLSIVTTVDPPRVLQSKVGLKVVEQVKAGHGTSREEVFGHPTVTLFKVVSRSVYDGQEVSQMHEMDTKTHGLVLWQKM